MTASRLRYWLDRSVGGPQGNWCIYVMLNPSTADDEFDDATIRRCRSFAMREGCAEMGVVNLSPERATDPRKLKHDLTYEERRTNLDFLMDAILLSDVLIFAWGATPFERHDTTKRAVHSYATMSGKQPLCLGATKDGHPRHPLYVPNAQPLEVWEP